MLILTRLGQTDTLKQIEEKIVWPVDALLTKATEPLKVEITFLSSVFIQYSSATFVYQILP